MYVLWYTSLAFENRSFQQKDTEKPLISCATCQLEEGELVCLHAESCGLYIAPVAHVLTSQ